MNPLIITDARTRLFKRTVGFAIAIHNERFRNFSIIESLEGKCLRMHGLQTQMAYFNRDIAFDSLVIRYYKSELTLRFFNNGLGQLCVEDILERDYLDFVFGVKPTHEKVMFKMTYL